MVKNAGGILVHAHPNDPNGTSLVSITPDLEEQARIIEQYMLDYIDGVECCHSRHDAKTTAYYIKFAKDHSLIMTGGSDCHQKPLLMGTLDIPDWVAEQFTENTGGIKMLDITRQFVEQYVRKHDDNTRIRKELLEERKIREWLAQQPEPRYFDKEHFVKICWWKSKRPRKHYENNNETLVKEAIRLVYQASEEKLKLHILTVLEGVGVPVASTLLHFLQPDKFPIFDVRVRSSLNEAGKWRNREVNDASEDAWLEYIAIMREISTKLGISLRELDKALWQYDVEKKKEKRQKEFEGRNK